MMLGAYNTLMCSRMAEGDDATIISVKAGYIFPNGLQPVVHYEMMVRFHLENVYTDHKVS